MVWLLRGLLWDNVHPSPKDRGPVNKILSSRYQKPFELLVMGDQETLETWVIAVALVT